MAVKQNNTDNTENTVISKSVKKTVSGGEAKGSTLKIKMKKTHSDNSSTIGNGNEMENIDSNVNGDQQDMCSEESPNANINNDNISQKPNEIGYILNLIDLVEQKTELLSPNDVLRVCRHLICELSHVHIPRQSPEALKRFKDDIAKVENFFAKSVEKRLYMFFLRIVCSLITADHETPSCAIAIIFQLFDTEMISDAVRSLLEQHNIPDQNIRKTVRLLSDWLRGCNFCQNLNLWIMAILIGLGEQQKFDLITEIALENIEQLFTALIVPVLRPKVACIVFHILSSITHTPLVFHKILPKFSLVITYLKQQATSMEDYAFDTKPLLQQLVDLTSALMVRFYGYEELYEPVDEVLKDFEPSRDYLNLICQRSKNDDLFGVGFNKNARVGLVNLGNTCYMNSVLQALAMTKEFSREILLIESKSPVLMKVQQQIALMLYSIRCEVTPSRVLNATRPPGFSPGLQQDSSEFLGYLLEMLHDQEVSYLKKKLNTLGHDNTTESCDMQNDISFVHDSGKAITIKGASALDQNNKINDAVIISTTNDTKNGNFDSLATQPTTLLQSTSQNISKEMKLISTIDKTFTGKLITTYRCLTCSWESRQVDSFRDLQLSFPEVKSECASNYSVQDLIDFYCSPEKLYGDNQYFCERCKRLTDAERFLSITNAPKNLILTLKHFKYDQKYHMRAKLMHKVFHDEKVSVKLCSDLSLEEVATVHYDLYAGVVHSGFSMDSGHYYTYASDSSNTWYKFNDNIVTTCTTEELHNLTPPNTPYILFYQMRARSNDISEVTPNIIPVDVPNPLKLDELPRSLRDYINHDNVAYTEEVKLQHFKMTSAAALRSQHKLHSKTDSEISPRYQRSRGGTDDEDENPPPGCGGNALNFNINRFIF